MSTGERKKAIKLAREVISKLEKEIDKLIQDYADSERSDYFASYNDCITLAREVRRLRRKLARK